MRVFSLHRPALSTQESGPNAAMTPFAPSVRRLVRGIMMRWRSGALAFDTRWLLCLKFIQATEEQQRPKAHMIPERSALSLPHMIPEPHNPSHLPFN